MSSRTAPPSGEPFADLASAIGGIIDNLKQDNDNLRNALTLAESALALLTWTPLTERQPAEDDGNDVGDVEFSDGSDIWQAQFDDTERATHWRRIVLP